MHIRRHAPAFDTLIIYDPGFTKYFLMKNLMFFLFVFLKSADDKIIKNSITCEELMLSLLGEWLTVPVNEEISVYYSKNTQKANNAECFNFPV